MASGVALWFASHLVPGLIAVTAGLGKLRDSERARKNLGRLLRLPRPAVNLVLSLLVLTELVVGAFVLLGTSEIASAMATTLFAVLAAAVVVLIFSGAAGKKCGCSAGTVGTVSWLLAVQDLGLALMAAGGLSVLGDWGGRAALMGAICFVIPAATALSKAGANPRRRPEISELPLVLGDRHDHNSRGVL